MSTNLVHVPAGFTAAEILSVKNANIGSVIVLPGDPAPADGLHRNVWSTLLTIFKPLLEMGATLIVPGPFGAAAAAIIEKGADAIQAKLDGEPLREKWTVDDMLAEKASIANPLT